MKHLLAALPIFAQDLGALSAETKTVALPVIPQVVNALQEAVAEKGAAGAIPVCKKEAPELIQAKPQETAGRTRSV